MNARSQLIVVYAAGLAQGVALVTFPAASAIFTNPRFYGLSSKQYGAIFLPQAIAAVITSWLGAEWSRRGMKEIYLVGIGADFLSMALFYTSRFLISDRSMTYATLLVATTSLGIGFGLTVPALNTLAGALSPGKIDSVILVLNALLGAGTALAPLLISILTKLGNWSLLPLLVAICLAVLWSIGLRLPMGAPASGPQSALNKSPIPLRFWLFGIFALLYGVIETINGNWATLFMQNTLHASASLSSLTLTMFWLAVTGGRLLVAAITQWLAPAIVFRALPLVCAAAVWLIASLGRDEKSSLGVATFALAGFGCSALLPLTISFAQEQLTSMTSAVAGAMIGFYQIGYGIAAFGVGSLLQSVGLPLSSLYRAAALIGLILCALAFVIVVPQPVRLQSIRSSR
jgi:MFS family permease